MIPSTFARLRTQLAPRLLASNLGSANLRVAARAAIVQPLMFAFALLVLRNAQATLFVVFAVFALVVLADFGGRPASRAAAFLGTTLVAAALVAVGTIASPLAWTAALVTLLVVFCVEFAGVFGGYLAGARTPLLMALVLAASVPAPAGAVPGRVLGWLIGGGVATAAALLLWPRYERDALRQVAADALRSLARLIAANRVSAASAEQRESAANAVTQLRTVYSWTDYRPGGPTRPDRAPRRSTSCSAMAPLRRWMPPVPGPGRPERRPPRASTSCWASAARGSSTRR